jgi:hypothetical protein
VAGAAAELGAFSRELDRERQPVESRADLHDGGRLLDRRPHGSSARDEQRERLEPSMSVKRKVTVPLGRSAPIPRTS